MAIALFRADITEVVRITHRRPADYLLFKVWREGEGLRQIKRN